jgi:hypothetical protein
VLENAFFYNSLSAELAADSTIPYSSAIPQNIKMEDFLSAIIKMFNLCFEYDKDISNKIFIEPRNDFYTTTVQDWSKKLDVSQPVTIEPAGVLDAKRYVLKYRQDVDWLNEKYQASYQQVKEESYGTKINTVDNDFLKNDNTLEVVFSPTPQYSDTTSNRVFPKIIKVDQNSQTANTVSSNLRILYYGGELDCRQWTFYDTAPNNPTVHTTYPYCGHIDHPVSPSHDFCFGVPKEIYYIPAWSATYTNNNIYNRFWKQFIDEITDKDSSIVTGWFHLTPADIAMLDFRHWYRFGFQNYRLNKIYDYNPVQDGLTKCEFIKTNVSTPFVSSSILLTGARDSAFDTGEQGPAIATFTVTSGTNCLCESCEESHTVAEMQALAASSQLDPCKKYLITDPMSSWGLLTIQACTATALEPYGTLYKDTRVYQVGYDLTLNEFTELHDTLYDNHIYSNAGMGFTALTNFPIDNNRYFGNVIYNSNLNVTVTSGATMQFNHIKDASVILDQNGYNSEVELTNNTIHNGSAVTIIGNPSGGLPSSMGFCNILSCCNTILLQNSASLSSCTIDNTVGFSSDNEQYANKHINYTESTFDKTMDISGISIINFTDGINGLNYSDRGIFHLTTSNASEEIDAFVNNASASIEKTFYGQAGTSIKFKNGATCVCIGGIDVDLNSEFDFIKFRFINDTAYELYHATY